MLNPIPNMGDISLRNDSHKASKNSKSHHIVNQHRTQFSSLISRNPFFLIHETNTVYPIFGVITFS